MNLANRILAVFESGLKAWDKYISTRQEAYERKQDKKQEKAINYAEEYMEGVSELFEFIHGRLEIPEEEKKTFEKIKKGLYKLKKKFNDND